MSYILEALKKSQSDREHGQVPRVEGFGIDVPVEAERSRPWIYLALLLGLITLVIAGLLLLRGPAGGAADDSAEATTLALPSPPREDLRGRAPAMAAGVRADAPDARGATPTAAPMSARPGYSDPAATPRPPPEVAVNQPSAQGPASAADQVPPMAPLAPPGSAPASSGATAAADPTGPSRAADGPAVAPMPAGPAQKPPADRLQPMVSGGSNAHSADAPGPLDTPESMSVEPQVLVVPAPGQDGEPLPRGAEELRRAVLGDGGSLSASVDTRDAGPRALPRPPAPDAVLPNTRSPSEQTPVPEDVLAEIDAFKELVRKRDPDALKRAAAARAPLPEPPGLQELERRSQPQVAALPPGPSLDLRNRLPPYSMNVHVYNSDPRQRFVYINGRRLSEGQESPEGIRLEQVVVEGAVLHYDGERFFQRR